MRILFLVLCVLLLTGCYPWISNENIKQAEKICQPHRGWKLVRLADSSAYITVLCNDGFATKISSK